MARQDLARRLCVRAKPVKGYEVYRFDSAGSAGRQAETLAGFGVHDSVPAGRFNLHPREIDGSPFLRSQNSADFFLS